jgi:RecA-family ATPase
MAIDLPSIEYAVKGIFPENSLGLLSAPRGVGKSWFVLELAISLSTGRPFFVWEVPQRFRTVIIDGEMGLALIKERLTLRHPARLNNLYFVTSDDFFKAGKTMNITDMETQAGLEQYFSHIKAKVLIFDNLSSLCGGLDENTNQDQHAYLSWFGRLRFLGYTVIFVDHKGKDAKRQGPRGASKKEDFVHISIELLPTSGKSQADFTISLVKCRHKRPEQENVRVRLNSDLSPAQWEIIDAATSELEDNLSMRLLQILSKPGSWTQTQLGKKLKVHQATIGRNIIKLVEDGLLTKERELTNKGLKRLEKLC